LIGKPLRKRPLKKIENGTEGYITTDVTVLCYQNGMWTELAQALFQLWAEVFLMLKVQDTLPKVKF